MNAGGDEHGFVPWEYGLAERDNAIGIIFDVNVTGAILTVGLIWEGFLDLPVTVVEEAAILN